MRLWIHTAFLLLAAPAMAQQVSVPLNAIPVGKGVGVSGFKTVLGSAGSGAKCLTDTSPPSFTTCPPPTVLRTANPGNLYVSKTGNDANNCLSSGTACLTIGRAAALARLAYDYQGAPLTINIAAGTYAEQVNFYGPAGLGGPGQAYIVLKGAGSTTTSINPSTNCGAGQIAVFVDGGARVGIGSIKLGTTCTNGYDLYIVNNSIAFPVDGDVNFAAATSALIGVAGGSAFDANYIASYPITFSGGSVYGFVISTLSRVVTGVGVTNVITGTPNFSGSFVDAIDGSFFNLGGSSSWSGSATGTRYALALNSYIDTEQITTALPGNSPGIISNGSYYYTYGALACVGGAGGCRIATAPTGFGTGATYGVLTGSGDQSGSFFATAGTGASSSGTIILATPSLLTGPIGGAGFCTVSLSNANTAWPAGSSVQSYYTNGGVTVSWYSNGSALVNGGGYYFNYTCQ